MRVNETYVNENEMGVYIRYLPDSSRVSEVRVSTTHEGQGDWCERLGVRFVKNFTSDGKVRGENYEDYRKTGASYHKNHSHEGKLLGETQRVLEGHKVNFTYDSDECLSSISIYTPSKRTFFDFNKGKLVQTKELILAEGHKWKEGIFKREEICKYDEKGRSVKCVIHIKKKDGTQGEFCSGGRKPELFRITEKKGEQCTQTTYDWRKTPKEFVEQKIQMGTDKCVEIEPNRSLWKKIWDARKEGATFGQVKRVVLSEKRSKVNADLKAIWASQLSPEEKKEKLRKVAAAFRVAQGKAPNPQVYKKLVKIHQQGR